MWPEALRSDYVLPDLPRSHSRHALLWTSFQLRYSIFPGDDLTNTTRASHQHLPFLSRKIPCCASAGAGGLDMQGVGVEHAAGSSCWGGSRRRVLWVAVWLLAFSRPHTKKKKQPCAEQ